MKMKFVATALVLLGSVNALAVNPEAPFNNKVFVCEKETSLDFQNNVFVLEGIEYQVSAPGKATYGKSYSDQSYVKSFNYGDYRTAEVHVVKPNSGKPYTFVLIGLQTGAGYKTYGYTCESK